MRVGIGLLALILFGTVGAHADDYPSRPISIIVPFGAGGAVDLPARAMAKVMAEKLGKPVIVENKVGAGGIVGAEYVAHAKPDGYNILFGSNGAVVSYPFLFKKLSYDPRTAFTAVHGILDTAFVLAIRPSQPYKTLPEFIAYAKKNPGKLNFYSTGQGSLQHLTTELFMKEADIKMAHIPYKTGGLAIADMLAGNIDVMIDSCLNLCPQISTGKMIALAVTGAARMRSLPDVMSFAEQGYPGVDTKAFVVAVVHKETPTAIVDLLSKLVSESLRDPNVSKFIEEQGAIPMFDADKEGLAKFLGAEVSKTKALIERAGLQPE